MSSHPPHRAAIDPATNTANPLAQLVTFAQARGLRVSITLEPGDLPLAEALDTCSDIARRCSHPLQVEAADGRALLKVTSVDVRPHAQTVAETAEQTGRSVAESVPAATIAPQSAAEPSINVNSTPHHERLGSAMPQQVGTAAPASQWNIADDTDDWPQGRRETQVLAVESGTAAAPASHGGQSLQGPPAQPSSARVSRRAVRENVATQSGDSW